MEYKYEIVKFNDNYPAKIYLQNKPGRRCNTSIHWHKAMELLYIIDGHLNVMEDGKITERGTHQELLKQRGYYWQTYCLQYGLPMTEQEEPTDSVPGAAVVSAEGGSGWRAINSTLTSVWNPPSGGST